MGSSKCRLVRDSVLLICLLFNGLCISETFHFNYKLSNSLLRPDGRHSKQYFKIILITMLIMKKPSDKMRSLAFLKLFARVPNGESTSRCQNDKSVCWKLSIQ